MSLAILLFQVRCGFVLQFKLYFDVDVSRVLIVFVSLSYLEQGWYYRRHNFLDENTTRIPDNTSCLVYISIYRIVICENYLESFEALKNESLTNIRSDHLAILGYLKKIDIYSLFLSVCLF